MTFGTFRTAMHMINAYRSILQQSTRLSSSYALRQNDFDGFFYIKAQAGVLMTYHMPAERVFSGSIQSIIIETSEVIYCARLNQKKVTSIEKRIHKSRKESKSIDRIFHSRLHLRPSSSSATPNGTSQRSGAIEEFCCTPRDSVRSSPTKKWHRCRRRSS